MSKNENVSCFSSHGVYEPKIGLKVTPSAYLLGKNKDQYSFIPKSRILGYIIKLIPNGGGVITRCYVKWYNVPGAHIYMCGGDIDLISRGDFNKSVLKTIEPEEFEKDIINNIIKDLNRLEEKL